MHNREVTHGTAKIGYVEGKNIVIDACYTENQIDRLPSLADELVAQAGRDRDRRHQRRARCSKRHQDPHC
jgi:hypothetical protein